ncbi:raftlin isoform X2 [Protopterus annectens]|uniref:raftlin isoform X2 n=1 Tax=Protopterus annectens TaxID=7888 RepID=UPI001CFA21E7|nr:raftlin isoform X2 [Protopterus annectens]
MGCRLQKLAKSDEKSPGKIYSTLKRSQVETKIGVSYDYRFLDFTTLNDETLRSSAIKLSSVPDLPVQLQDHYQQGYVLAAVHPFMQPCASKETTPQEQIFRAVLIKKAERSENTDDKSEMYSLDIEWCLSCDQLPDSKLIPHFIKKVEEAASQGLKYVGFIHQYNSSVNSIESPSETSSYNLSCKLSGENDQDDDLDRNAEMDGKAPVPGDRIIESVNDKLDVFTVFHKMKTTQNSSKYYTMSLPLKISRNGQCINNLQASWLEHMTDHFKKGSSLVNAVFYPGLVNDSSSDTVTGQFIFEDAYEEESNTTQGFDAIVVEQWTILDGLEVKTDYIPLLKSLAAYGWQLTCVLPTPVVKTNRDGSWATKQIVFLQRPSMPTKEKKKESKKKSSKKNRQDKCVTKNNICNLPKYEGKDSKSNLKQSEGSSVLHNIKEDSQGVEEVNSEYGKAVTESECNESHVGIETLAQEMSVCSSTEEVDDLKSLEEIREGSCQNSNIENSAEVRHLEAETNVNSDPTDSMKDSTLESVDCGRDEEASTGLPQELFVSETND